MLRTSRFPLKNFVKTPRSLPRLVQESNRPRGSGENELDLTSKFSESDCVILTKSRNTSPISGRTSDPDSCVAGVSRCLGDRKISLLCFEDYGEVLVMVETVPGD